MCSHLAGDPDSSRWGLLMHEFVSLAHTVVTKVFDTDVLYHGVRWKRGVAHRTIHYFPPWLDDEYFYATLVDGESVLSTDPNDPDEWLRITLESGSGKTIYITFERSAFQYQIIFNLDHPKVSSNRALLEVEYAKLEGATSIEVTQEDPDCFPRVVLGGGDCDGISHVCWLCQAIEYGRSPCWPLPWYLCPYPSPETIYMRGECDCDYFRNTLRPLGIPCSHLVAAFRWYSGEPAWCGYIQCP
jgi:hypothetical protein